MMNRAMAVLCCCLFVSVASTAAITTATTDSPYTVTIPGSIDTPEQTITVEESTYAVNSIARVPQGDALEVQTSGPSNESYRVYIHAVKDGSYTTYDTKVVFADSDDEVSFDTSEYAAGSYVVSIYHDGTYYDPQPLVIPAYEADLSMPNTVQSQEQTEVSVSLTEKVAGKTVERVEIVVANDDTTKRLEATNSAGTYTAKINSLEPGEYQVHAVVYSPEDAAERTNEVIGISDAAALTIEEESQPITTTTKGSNTSPSEATTTTDSTTSKTPTTTQMTTQSQTPASQTSTTTETLSTSVTDTTSVTKTLESSPTTNAVLTPANKTSTDNQDTGTSTTNGVVGEYPLMLLALLAAGGLLVRSAT